LFLQAPCAHAARPLVTDDARVVGEHGLQLETWVRGDRGDLEHWALVGFGPVDRLEISVGGVYGTTWSDSNRARFAFNAPVVQAKLMLYEARENQWPGIAVVGGVNTPLGTNGFQPPGWSAFSYFCLTQSLFDRERLLVHANLGFAGTTGARIPFQPLWGLGVQLRTVAGLHVVGEIFSGDPYAHGIDGATQVGVRYIFSDHVQLDSTVGTGLWGTPALDSWASVGVRLVSGRLW
jgi:hypothetical protein